MWAHNAAAAIHRRLSAILAIEAVDHSRLLQREEAAYSRRLRLLRDELVDPGIAAHHGRIVEETADRLMAEFASVVDAVACAIAIQRGMYARNWNIATASRITFRAGVNIGDLVIDGDAIHGEGVDVAARLKALCEPGGICVSGAAADQVRDILPLALADRGEQEIDRGARKVRIFSLAEADLARMPTGAGGVSPEAKPPERKNPPLLSVVVLPFANFSSDSEQDYFADGITEDLTTDISRISGSFVIARNTAFTYKGQAVDVRQIGRELGVRYALEGSVRRTEQQVRLNAQLIEVETGAHIWADRFDGHRQDLVSIQNEVTGRIARALNLALVDADARRTLRQRRLAPTILDHIALGRFYFNKAYSPENDRAARRHFKEALARDGAAVEAMSGLAMVLANDLAHGWSENRREDIAAVEQLVENALDLDPRNADTHFAKGQLLRTQGRMDDAIAALEVALSINPHHYHAMRGVGYLYYFSGNLEKAIAFSNEFMRMSPRDPELAVLYWVKGSANLQLGNPDVAARFLREARSINPNLWFVHYSLAGALGLMGEIDEAKTSVAAFRGMKPEYSSLAAVHAALPYLNDQRYLARAANTVELGLERAGFPRE